MKEIRLKTEEFFFKLGCFLIRFRWLVIICAFLISIFLGSQVKNLKIDTSTEGFFRADDPEMIKYNDFREQFGRDEMIVLGIESDQIFSLDFLTRLKKLHAELEETIPHLDDINSLVNARWTHGKEGELIVEDLLENFPQAEADLKKLKQKVISNPLYKNLLISEDATLATLVIKTNAYSSSNTKSADTFSEDSFAEDTPPSSFKQIPLTDKENSEIVNALKFMVKKYNQDKFKIYFSGSPVVTDHLKRGMQKDVRRFIGISLLAIGIFLALLFRKSCAVFIPLLIVMLSLFWTIALMALTKTALKTPTTILPSFIMAVGVGYSVHLLAIFFNEYKEKKLKHKAIIKALIHSGLPILMTCLTTAVGLFSFTRAEIASVGDLGLFSGIGVILAMVNSILLLPPLLYIFPVTQRFNSKENKQNKIDYFLKFLAMFSTKNSKQIIIAFISISLLAGIGLIKLRFAHNTLEWFSPQSLIRMNTDHLDKELKGTLTAEIIIDSQIENGLYAPEIQNSMEAFKNYLNKYRLPDGSKLVYRTISLADMLKEINQALNENKPEFYTIPQNRQLIAQELLLFENSGSDDLEDLVNNQFSKTRFTIKVPWGDSMLYAPVFKEITAEANKLFNGRAEISDTGLILLFCHTISAMANSMFSSYLVAGILITLLMILMINNFKLGLISMIPNLAPIILTLGFMGWASIPLDMFTILIGSIAIGLAVDDTIHFFHNFKRYYKETGSKNKSIKKTMLSTGKAMLFTSVVLSCSFFLYIFTSLENLFNFGLLTALTIILAFLTDVLLAPALICQSKIIKN